MACKHTQVQRQTTVTAYIKSNQSLLFATQHFYCSTAARSSHNAVLLLGERRRQWIDNKTALSHCDVFFGITRGVVFAFLNAIHM